MSRKIIKYKHDLGMYLLMSNNAIEEAAYKYELTYEDVVLFLWVIYLHELFIEGNYYQAKRVAKIMDDLRLDIPHSEGRIKRLFIKLYDRKTLKKVGARYLIEDRSSIPIFGTMHSTFIGRLSKLERSIEEGISFKWFSKRVNPRPVGRPKGYSQKHKKHTIKYTCRIPFKSKTNQLFK